MMDSELFWANRAKNAEAELGQLKDKHDAAIGPVKKFKKEYGVRELDNGGIVIDFEKFAARLGHDAAMELRGAIDRATWE